MSDGVGSKAGKVMVALFNLLANGPIVSEDIELVSDATKTTVPAVEKALSVYERMGYVSITRDAEDNIVSVSSTPDAVSFMSDIGVTK